MIALIPDCKSFMFYVCITLIAFLITIFVFPIGVRSINKSVNLCYYSVNIFRMYMSFPGIYAMLFFWKVITKNILKSLTPVYTIRKQVPVPYRIRSSFGNILITQVTFFNFLFGFFSRCYVLVYAEVFNSSSTYNGILIQLLHIKFILITNLQYTKCQLWRC